MQFLVVTVLGGIINDIALFSEQDKATKHARDLNTKYSGDDDANVSLWMTEETQAVELDYEAQPQPHICRDFDNDGVCNDCGAGGDEQ